MSEKGQDPFPPHFSQQQREFWAGWVRAELGPDDKQRWYGYCPMHQPELEGSPDGKTEALFDLWLGNWRCLGAPGENSCNAPKKAGTTTNLQKYIDEVVHAAF